ncbi:MAG: glycosyltransferase [Flavobacteriales bacterium]|nr:MAG: glycosyltransferase [Flavobacteriales bacterium]
MKITLITVVYNGEKFLEDCIKSVLAQDYRDIEYIVIDGASTDASLTIANKYRDQIEVLLSEKDKGMYDALNKGIALAKGEVIGLLNADDMLASADVVTAVAERFGALNPDGIYGDLNYINPNRENSIVRKWIGKSFTSASIGRGWMPAHPTLYLKKTLFEKYGNYSLEYGTAADYELMLRFLYRFRINAIYLNKLMVKMRTGGISNASLKHRRHALANDLKAIKANEISFPYFTLLLKKMRKITQFFH